MRINTALATLLLAAAGTANAGHDYKRGDLDIDIVADYGQRFEVYPVDERRSDTWRAYLQAEQGANYAIRVRNRGPHRLGLVIAVDGRNIISGERSNLKRKERMYILGPYESATYDGWRSSRNRVNRFYFTEVEDSYADAFGDRSAMGVIAVAAFREKHQYRAPQTYRKRDDRAYQENRAPSASDGKSRQAPREKSSRSYDNDEPGTGYGDDRYSPSVQVQFSAEKQASSRYFLKYEWRATLCEMGLADCARRDHRRNRFWKDDRYGFAPPPPRIGKRYRARHW